MHIPQIQTDLKHAIEEAIKKTSLKIPLAKELSELPKIEIGIPKDYKHGDLTTNVAMRLAKNFSLNSVKLAGYLKEELEALAKNKALKGVIEKIEVLPPGFINFRFSASYLYALLGDICEKDDTFGRTTLGRGIKVNMEFVSANPTGPLTVAHGRQAAVGDALSRILDFSGYSVWREYFINDVGTQIEILGKSIQARYLELNGIECEFPADGYQGEYIKGIAEELNKKYGKKFIEKKDSNLQYIAQFGARTILESIRGDLERLGIHFNGWFSQQKISPDIIRDVLKKLRSKGYVYDKDGATWFKSTAFGDDKDRVVIKSDGAFTYLAPDIAYHLDKCKRKFNKLIDIWGPDHHGYIPRIKAAVEALGYDRESISVLIVQLATLFRNGVQLSMSTRKGEFVTLKEVVDEVGSDVTKFFFLMRKLDSHLDFDLEIAKKNSLDNPVYYIQYAHARIASIFGFSANIKDKLKAVKYESGLLMEPEETRLLRMLSQFPLIVESAATGLEPYRVVEYLNELAKIFHSFYTKHRVVSEDDLPLTKARLELVRGVKVVLANGLSLLGVSLPERM
ncbi:arginine--tRNA ligase [Candidatus Omnitrophota bacterium]